MDDRVATTGPAGTHAEDKCLIARFLAGDAAAFERLFRKYQRPLFVVCLRFFGNAADAEDVLQDAFLQIYTGLARFNGRSTFFTWAYSVAVHACLTKARQAKRSTGMVDGSLFEGRSPDPLRQQVRDAVQALPDRYRMVVILQYYQGLSQAEIAQVLHWTVGQVKINAHRARNLLRESLGREEYPAAPEGARECGGES
ncbi:MAG: RNA polymerase sigma factor [Armatimonadota bacterium]